MRQRSGSIITGSGNGLSLVQRQFITWTNAELMSFGPLGINFDEILIKIQWFPFTKIHLKMLSAKWQPFFLCLNVLTFHPKWWLYFGMPQGCINIIMSQNFFCWKLWLPRDIISQIRPLGICIDLFSFVRYLCWNEMVRVNSIYSWFCFCAWCDLAIIGNKMSIYLQAML